MFETNENSNADEDHRERDRNVEKNVCESVFCKTRPNIWIVVMLIAVFVFEVIAVGNEQGRKIHKKPPDVIF